MPRALSVAFGASFLPEEASCPRKPILHFTGRSPSEKLHFHRKMHALTEPPSGREVDFRPDGEERQKEPAA